jgi:colanic acid/amylovoran biosynthesis protein
MSDAHARRCAFKERLLADPREISIGLLWHATAAGNLGVGALTVGNLIAARAAAESVGLMPRFTIVEFKGDFSGEPYVSGADITKFEITGRSLVSPRGYWQRLKDFDCILDIGGGDSFAEIYGAKRFAFLAATKELAYLRGVPLLLSPQTVGPFTRQPFRAIAAHLMNKAAATLARDPQSMAAIGELAPRARAAQSIDVAFRLPFERPSRSPGGPVEIGVNVSGLLFNGGYSGANEFGLQIDYAQTMRSFIAEQAARENTRVHLICHVNSDRLPKDDDGRVADLLAKEFPAVIRAPNFSSPSAAKSYIAGMDFLVGGRMHACIAAFSALVPVVPIAYSRKFSGLFQGMLNYEYQVPVSGMSTGEAVAYLHRCLENRGDLAKAIARGLPVVEGALGVYDVELQRLFRIAAKSS